MNIEQKLLDQIEAHNRTCDDIRQQYNSLPDSENRAQQREILLRDDRRIRQQRMLLVRIHDAMIGSDAAKAMAKQQAREMPARWLNEIDPDLLPDYLFEAASVEI